LKKDIENFNACYERKKAEAEAQRARRQALTDARHSDEDAFSTR
jgi:hypothetical protein